MANELKHITKGTSLTQAEFEHIDLHACNSQATGDLIYASSATQLSRLAKGAANTVLVMGASVPAWSATLAGLTLTSPTINGTIATTGLTLPAVTLGGNMTVTGKAFDAGAASAQINTTGASLGLLVISTQDAIGGARLELRHDSVSPAVDDVASQIMCRGRDSAGNLTVYGSLNYLITNPTDGSEGAKAQIRLMNAGADNEAMTLSGAGALWTDLSVDTLTYKVSGTQVVSARGAAVADAAGGATVDAEARTALNALLARLRTHGLIAAA